jgi:hypothetical protein
LNEKELQRWNVYFAENMDFVEKRIGMLESERLKTIYSADRSSKELSGLEGI